MTEVKFTQGPLEIVPYEPTGHNGDIGIFRKGRGLVAVTLVQQPGLIGDEVANAYLYRASPELHEALQAALCDDPDWRRLAVAALAKAEGRAP